MTYRQLYPLDRRCWTTNPVAAAGAADQQREGEPAPARAGGCGPAGPGGDPAGQDAGGRVTDVEQFHVLADAPTAARE